MNDRESFVSQIGTNSPTGFDVDLMNYIADLIRVKFTYQYKLFTELIPAVQSDTNAISISMQTDTVAQEQFVNFAQFFQTGTGFFLQSYSTLTIQTVGTSAKARNAVQNGGAQVGLQDNALIAYFTNQSNTQLKAVDTTYNIAPYGILCNKQNSALCCSLINAINYLI